MSHYYERIADAICRVTDDSYPDDQFPDHSVPVSFIVLRSVVSVGWLVQFVVEMKVVCNPCEEIDEESLVLVVSDQVLVVLLKHHKRRILRRRGFPSNEHWALEASLRRFIERALIHFSYDNSLLFEILQTDPFHCGWTGSASEYISWGGAI